METDTCHFTCLCIASFCPKVKSHYHRLRVFLLCLAVETDRCSRGILSRKHTHKHKSKTQIVCSRPFQVQDGLCRDGAVGGKKPRCQSLVRLSAKCNQQRATLLGLIRLSRATIEGKWGAHRKVGLLKPARRTYLYAPVGSVSRQSVVGKRPAVLVLLS
jgi:hypothetical protein